jgi:hypothetical protein
MKVGELRVVTQAPGPWNDFVIGDCFIVLEFNLKTMGDPGTEEDPISTLHDVPCAKILWRAGVETFGITYLEGVSEVIEET